jgi:hypothetical protein
MGKKFVIAGLAAVVALALACAKDSSAPLSPSGGAGDTNAEGATLKVGAPTTISPVNDQQPTLLELVAGTSEVKYGGAQPLQYNFEVYDAANTRVVNETADGPSLTVATPLDFGKRYTWRVRATIDGAFGPFSTVASFVAPAGGYNIAGELYDPLINGRSVGTVHGNVEFIPGVGAHFLDNNAYIDYLLPETITDGEISAVVSNLCTCSGQPGIKTKVFAMGQGYDNLTDNDRRMTAEKRSGADKGVVAWRFITRQSQIDTVGEERVRMEFDPATDYLWTGSFRDNFFNLTIDNVNAHSRFYEFGKPYDGTYNPTPHVVYIGSPPTTSGPDSGTLSNMIVRHLWVSHRTRPESISK